MRKVCVLSSVVLFTIAKRREIITIKYQSNGMISFQLHLKLVFRTTWLEKWMENLYIFLEEIEWYIFNLIFDIFKLVFLICFCLTHWGCAVNLQYLTYHSSRVFFFTYKFCIKPTVTYYILHLPYYLYFFHFICWCLHSRGFALWILRSIFEHDSKFFSGLAVCTQQYHVDRLDLYVGYT